MSTFISYSRRNEDFVVRLAKDLKAAGHDVWLDQLDIPEGARWDDELEKALRTCSTFLIVLSPESIKSQNVKDEIGYAIDSGKRILPVMIKQCEVPFRLRRFQYIDFTKEDLDEYNERFTEIKSLLANTAQLPTATESEKSSSPVKVPVSKPETNKFLSTPVLLGGGAVIIAIILAVIFMGGRDPSPATAAPTETAAPSDTPEPQIIVVTSTSPPTPTSAPDEPTPEPQPFYTEEFSGDLSSWSTFVTSGDQNRLEINTVGGRMVFDLGDPNSDLFAYAVNNDFTYENVQLETVAINRGVNENNVSLICRYSSSGWYEFNIGNDGLYTILAYDSIIGYDPLFSGGSTAIKGGQSTNKYTALCEDNRLTLWINDVKVRTVTVNRYNYPRGKIGLSVSSFGVLPVKVEFESLVVSEP